MKLKEAYDTLIDPEKRKKYDSTIVFDDSIPEDKEYTEKDFFTTFGPVFLNNGIWSKKKPVPKLGDMQSPLQKVKLFYKFWHNFQSWRDFSVEGEYDLEEATSRFEKRQMLKENKKNKNQLTAADKAKLIETIRQQSNEGLTQIVKIILKNCPEGIEDIDSDKLQIKIDFLTTKEFNLINEYVEKTNSENNNQNNEQK